MTGLALRQTRGVCREMVAQVARDNTVMVTWANFHYRDFVMNWVHHVKATGCEAYIVGAPGKGPPARWQCAAQPCDGKQLCACGSQAPWTTSCLSFSSQTTSRASA